MSGPIHSAALANNTFRRALPIWSVLSLARAKRRKGFPSCFGGYVTLRVEEHYEALSCRCRNA
jgi:hypothetical protein